MDDAAEVMGVRLAGKPAAVHVPRGLLEDRRQDRADSLGERRQLSRADPLRPRHRRRVRKARHRGPEDVEQRDVVRGRPADLRTEMRVGTAQGLQHRPVLPVELLRPHLCSALPFSHFFHGIW
jgi:hypothetical protein